MIVYLAHEAGSGDGPMYGSSSNSAGPLASSSTPAGGGGSSNFRISPGQSGDESSVSPSLIMAKCWNNFENDNDCKQINVITAANSNEQPAQSLEDDSIITPVVIFESASSLPPGRPDPSEHHRHHQPPAYLEPPYFSTSTPSQPLARHRTPPPAGPTANDVYAAPPAGATILAGHQAPASGSGRPTARPAGATPVTEWPGGGLFVATPRSKAAPKTTTQGRKCRDENDADCDEPDEEEDQQQQQQGGKRPGSPKANEEDDDDDQSDSSSRSGAKGESNMRPANERGKQSEIGSGNGPDDDNEDDSDDADDPDDGNPLESSGRSEPASTEPGTRYVEVSSSTNGPNKAGSPHIEGPSRAPDLAAGSSSSARPGAEIEVVVHSTLPPTFPITTRPNQDRTGSTGEDEEDESSSRGGSGGGDQFPNATPPSQSSGTSTPMPDDTFKSKPVFPPTSSPDTDDAPSALAPPERALQAAASGGHQQHHLHQPAQSEQPGREQQAEGSTELDLATFKPIPMPAVEPDGLLRRLTEQQRNLQNFSDASNGQPDESLSAIMGLGQQQQHQQQSGTPDEQGPPSGSLPDRYKFEPATSTQSPSTMKFDKPWRAQPVRPPAIYNPQPSTMNGGGTGGDQWRSRRPDAQSSASDPGQINGQPMAPVRMQPDMLPTLLLYASIVILIVTAFIFVIMALAFWRRNTARQRMLLLHKSQQLLNGAGSGSLPGGLGPNPLVGMSLSSQHLMGQQAQPGLLSTYAPPGKGMMGAGKVTTSVIKPDGADIIGEEDEDEEENESRDAFNMSLEQENQRLHQEAESSMGEETSNQQESTRGLPGGPGGPSGGGGGGQGGGSSWSASDDPTTSSGGSSKTDPGSQVQQPSSGRQQHQAPGRLAPYHPNSLSDGRQNSSSISDSQASPDDGMSQQQQPPHQQGPVQVSHQVQVNHQQQQRAPPQQAYACQPPYQSGPEQAYHHPQQPQGTFDATCGPLPQVAGPGRQPLPPGGPTHLYNQQQPSAYPPVISDSVKKFNSSRSVENFHQQQEPFFIQQPAPYLGLQQSPFNNHRGHQQPIIIGQQGFNKQPMGRQAYLANYGGPFSPGGHSIDGYRGPAPPIINGAPPPIRPYHPSAGQLVDDFHLQLNGPVSPARVAMNPLATLGRRGYQQPGSLALNRSVYSEDSSSLITASPSLARTSSSLSFAFSNGTASQQPQQQSQIRAKPMLDPAGRIVNDYTANYPAGATGPPILGPKGRGGSWYV